jgi:hypothetical protein
VPRDGDGDLALALDGARLVVVQGRSASGKTRMAAELMRRRFPHRLLLAPRDGKALRDLAGVGLPLSNVVVWLDDLERFAGPNGLDTVLLNRLCPPGSSEVVLLATLRDEERGAVDNEIDRLLRLATTVRVSFEWTEDERESARGRRSDPWIADWLDHGEGTGLAEHVVAGPAVLERWQSGRNGKQLAAAALVSAAIDCRRAGFVEPVPGAALVELSRGYLDPRDAHRPGAPDVGENVVWATAQLLPHPGRRRPLPCLRLPGRPRPARLDRGSRAPRRLALGRRQCG